MKTKVTKVEKLVIDEVVLTPGQFAIPLIVWLSRCFCSLANKINELAQFTVLSRFKIEEWLEDDGKATQIYT